jgi:hypothetical protein
LKKKSIRILSHTRLFFTFFGVVSGLRFSRAASDYFASAVCKYRDCTFLNLVAIAGDLAGAAFELTCLRLSRYTSS